MASAELSTKPLFALRPSLINALLPSIAKNFFYTLLWATPLLLAYYILHKVGVIVDSLPLTLAGVGVLLFFIALAPVAIEILILANTTYFFFPTHVESEFRFFVIRKTSVTYEKITSITLDVSLWDRLCRAGDITLHTTDEHSADVTLRYIVKPAEVESKIYTLIGKRPGRR